MVSQPPSTSTSDCFAGQMLGPYQLFELLGKGAMSAVYRGYDTRYHRPVAVKILTINDGAERYNLTQRFRLEARTMASLKHPNIVPFYDFGVIDDVSFLVTRLMTGGTLEDHILRFHQQRRLPSLPEVTQIIAPIADALAYAHSRGVLHRDVKASNILFDGQGQPYLTDFGIAKLLDGGLNLTHPHMVVGTPDYMAHEQWRGETLSPAADQYGLGVVAYLLLTGRLPFDAPSSHGLMYQHLDTTPAPISRFRPDVSPQLEGIVQKALAKLSQDRFGSVLDFVKAFAEEIERSALSTTPPEFVNYPLSETVEVTVPSHSPSVPSPLSSPSSVRNFPDAGTRRLSAPRPSSPRRSRQTALLIGLGGGLALLGLMTVALLAFAMTRPAQTTVMIVTSEALEAEITPAAVPDAAATPGLDLSAVSVLPVFGSEQRNATPTIALVSTAPDLQLFHSFSANALTVRSVAIDPTGQRIAFSNGTFAIEIWDIATQQRLQTLEGHTDTVHTLAFSPDGLQLASGSADGTARLWDLVAEQTRFVLSLQTGEVRGLAFNHAGTLLALTGEDTSVHLWDMETGTLQASLEGHTSRILSVAFNNDDTLLVSGSTDSTVMVWNLVTGQRLTLTGHTGEVRSVAFHPLENIVGSGGIDGTIRLWNAETGDLIRVLDGSARELESIGFSPDGAFLASGDRANQMMVWDVFNGEIVAENGVHSGWVFDVKFSPTGNYLVSAGGDGAVNVFSLE
ncbi:MAG: serine/threonine-protein kinase [bacterium]|nr:serine/threonine-protein kinase [bacterium]